MKIRMSDAFENAWNLVKAPFHGTSERDYNKIIQSGGLKPNTFAAGYKGESQIDEDVKTTEEEAMEDAWEYAVNNVLSSGKGTPHLLYINPDHPDVYLEPDQRQGYAFKPLPDDPPSPNHYSSKLNNLGEIGHVISQADIPLEAIEPVFEGDPYDEDDDWEDEWYEKQINMLRGVLY
jgi:hypothetical protein